MGYDDPPEQYARHDVARGKNLGCPSRRWAGIETHVTGAPAPRAHHRLRATILRIAARQRCQTCHKIGLLPRLCARGMRSNQHLHAQSERKSV